MAQALKNGELTPEEARTHPYRHLLLCCLDREDVDEVNVQALALKPGDRLFLCSDGLTEELSDQLIASCLQSNPAIEQAVVSLIQTALAKGGHDNITVLMVAID